MMGDVEILDTFLERIDSRPVWARPSCQWPLKFPYRSDSDSRVFLYTDVSLTGNLEASCHLPTSINSLKSRRSIDSGGFIHRGRPLACHTIHASQYCTESGQYAVLMHLVS